MNDLALAAGVLLPGFAGTELPEWVARRLDDGMAGVCLFGDNIVDPQQLRALTDDIVSHNPRAIIALDEEGGDVTRLFYDVGSPSPGNAWLGQNDDVRTTFETAEAIARQLRAVGCNLNFAPSADVNSNADNPVIGVRSFSADPAVAARHTAAWVAGHQGIGVAVSAKHFPGHGDTQTDSHLALPVVDADLETLLARELPPFLAAIEAGAWTIMTSHILLPALDDVRPATFSPLILGGLLRDRLGFSGVVVSDALDMAGASGDTGIPSAAVRALLGGCDLLCIGSHNSDEQLDDIQSAIAAAVVDGQGGEGSRLSRSRLADAARRVAELGDRLRSLRDIDGPSTRSFAPPPDQLVAGGANDLARVLSAFEVSAKARRLLDDARERGMSWTVVQFETTPNAAVGSAPWGPVAATSGAEVAQPARHTAEGGPVLPPRRVMEVATGVDAIELLNRLGTGPVALVGRDNQRHEWVRSMLNEIRRLRPDVLVVDMGWPDQTRSYADIATFGASRLLGAGLLELLSTTPTDSGEGSAVAAESVDRSAASEAHHGRSR